jgi:hypothetical protein
MLCGAPRAYAHFCALGAIPRSQVSCKPHAASTQSKGITESSPLNLRANSLISTMVKTPTCKKALELCSEEHIH